MTLRIATWNINGVKARIEVLTAWLKETAPDVACLQEIKSVDEGFPREAIEDLGYNVATHGQKGFNGVALLSKEPLEDITPRLPGNEDDDQARYLEGTLAHSNGAIRIASLYLPNGNPITNNKFTYKLAWMERLAAHADALLAEETPFVLAGDYNVIPDDIDVHNPDAWTDDALFQPETRAAYRALLAKGLTDGLRACRPLEEAYTFWDYQAGAWQKNNGIRIDHLLLSPGVADQLVSADIDRHVRGWEKPSDHVPVWVELDVSV